MRKVLLVDPKTHSREQTERMLDWKNLGFGLHGYANTPADAMFLLNKSDFSLVLINMNGIPADGMRLCDQIRRRSRIPIILIGGTIDFQLARQALNYQVSNYLPDPVRPDELMRSLQTVKGELESGQEDEDKAASLSADERPAASSPSIIDKVKEYVESALHQNITLKKISDLLHFNCSYLGQKFKIHVNMTFNEYLLQQRMERAKYLLENTDMKVYEIANKVGYTEMDWFYKKFKAYTGISANEYRKMISILV